MLRISSLWMWTAHERRCDLGVKLLSKGLTAKSCFLSAFPAARKINPSFLKGDLRVCHAEFISRTLVRLSRRLPRDKASLAATLPSDFSKPAISVVWAEHATFPVPLQPNSSTDIHTTGRKGETAFTSLQGNQSLAGIPGPTGFFSSLVIPLLLMET